MTKTYGTMQAKPGDRCTNSPHVEIFTTPCCYSDQTSYDTECAACGAPIRCEYESVPVAVCTIREDGDDD